LGWREHRGLGVWIANDQITLYGTGIGAANSTSEAGGGEEHSTIQKLLPQATLATLALKHDVPSTPPK